MRKASLYLSIAAVAAFAISSCRKNNLVVDQDVAAPAFVKFNTILPADTATTLYVSETQDAFKLPIGITNVSDKDRTIQISYSSNTATRGTHFTGPTSITIPAGKAADTLTIQGLFAGYASAPSTRVDTVRVTLGGDVPTNAYKGTYTLYLRKYCNVTINNFAGVYNNTREVLGTSAYGPYRTTVTNITPVSATKAIISVSNIYDTGWGPIEFELDWSNKAAHTTRVIAKSTGIGDAGDLSATYAGQQVAVRANNLVGTFNACDPMIRLNFQLGTSGGVWFSTSYTVTLMR